MSPRPKVREESQELRRKAEVNLSRMIAKTVPSLNPENVEALAHELRVHQIELQLQNHELQRTRDEAEQSRDRYRELYESIPVGFATIDCEGRIYDVNPAGASLLGIESEGRAANNFFSFVCDDDVDAATLFCRKVIVDHETTTCELRMKKRDGSRFMVALQGAIVEVRETQKEERARVAFSDITRAKQAEETLRQQQVELEANRLELQDFMGKLFAAQEEERRRIACDLHDDYCQRITAVILEVCSMEKLVKTALPTLVSRTESLKEKLAGLLDDFRHLTHELHPRHLDTVSLASSMRAHIKEFSEYADLQIDFHDEDVPTHLPMPIIICLYRLLQESLGNIRKHANATHVVVTLRGRSEAVELHVADDGAGFNRGELVEGKTGLGLTSMRERVRPLRGRVIVESQPGRGTTVTVTIPVDREVV
jgi:PAS domain S-box-containing protein